MTEQNVEKPPICPGCNEPAKENTYPPGTKGWWWCERCLLRKIQKARHATD